MITRRLFWRIYPSYVLIILLSLAVVGGYDMFASMKEGILAVDTESRLLHANRTASGMLDIDIETQRRKSVRESVPGKGSAFTIILPG